MSAPGRVARAALLLSLSGCGGVRLEERPLPPDLAWPPGEPRVRLERVIEGRRGGGALAWLAGGEGEGRLFERPYGVAWQGDDLLVADPGAGRVARVSAGGRVSFSPEDAAGRPLALAACPQGIVAVDAEGGRVALLGPDLRRVRFLAEGLSRPAGVACAGDTVVLAETGAHRLVKLERDGTRRTLGERGGEPGRFNFPTALALAGDELLVGDTLNFRVQRLDLESGGARGAFGALGDAPGDMPRLKGLALDAAGHVWVSDERLDRVSLYTPAGELLLSLGGSGGEPGRFSFPAGVAAHPDGRVAVADSLNRRVQVFRLLGVPGARP